jgi:hypothetical protein
VVYVSIDDLVLRRGSIFIDMSVFGLYPGDAREAMRVLTQVFSRLAMGNAPSRLGFYFGMLAREKVYIASIPEDTYLLLNNPPLDEALRHAVERGGRVLDLFVDAGSPFRNIYIASEDYTHYDGARGYRIIGLGYLARGEVNIHADFSAGPPPCEARWCTSGLVERIERLTRGSELCIEPYPGMGGRVRRLLEGFMKPCN